MTEGDDVIYVINREQADPGHAFTRRRFVAERVGAYGAACVPVAGWVALGCYEVFGRVQPSMPIQAPEKSRLPPSWS